MRHFFLRHPFDRSLKASVTPVDARTEYRHRLHRWAAALDRNPAQPLWLLRNVEMSSPEMTESIQNRLSWLQRRLGALPPGLQPLVLGQITALTIAARDPALYDAGLTSDRYSLALRFFGLRDDALHHIICFCAYGREPQAPAHAIAARIRSAADFPFLPVGN
jgi:hypothetical protein